MLAALLRSSPAGRSPSVPSYRPALLSAESVCPQKEQAIIHKLHMKPPIRPPTHPTPPISPTPSPPHPPIHLHARIRTNLLLTDLLIYLHACIFTYVPTYLISTYLHTYRLHINTYTNMCSCVPIFDPIHTCVQTHIHSCNLA